MGSVRILSGVDVAVGADRIIGDGGWHVRLTHRAHPDFRSRSPVHPLLADEPRSAPRERQDFVPTAPGSIGMGLGSVSALRGRAAQ